LPDVFNVGAHLVCALHAASDNQTGADKLRPYKKVSEFARAQPAPASGLPTAATLGLMGILQTPLP
jgi:hypothetical protein